LLAVSGKPITSPLTKARIKIETKSENFETNIKKKVPKKRTKNVPERKTPAIECEVKLIIQLF